MTPQEAIIKAVEIAGSQHLLAAQIGCSQANVSKMIKAGKASPAYVLSIEEATAVSRHDLAPLFYPRTPVSRSRVG